MSAKKDPPKNAVTVVRELAAKGSAQRSICRALGVAYETWQKWKEEYPEIQAALDEGLAIEHDLLVGSLLESAVKQKNVTAAIFLLKTRHGHRENEPLNINKPQVFINFELPGALDAKTYEEQILCKTIEKKVKQIGQSEC